MSNPSVNTLLKVDPDLLRAIRATPICSFAIRNGPIKKVDFSFNLNVQNFTAEISFWPQVGHGSPAADPRAAIHFRSSSMEVAVTSFSNVSFVLLFYSVIGLPARLNRVLYHHHLELVRDIIDNLFLVWRSTPFPAFRNDGSTSR